MTYLPFDRLPGMNALFLDYIQHPEKVADLYPSRNEISLNPNPHREELCRILQKQNEAYGNTHALPLLDRLRSPDTRCTITGQQVGLLTGPLYTAWKALTAIQLADKANREGKSCVPVFWMATEDHNLHEIAAFSLLRENLELVSLSLKNHLFVSKQPAGAVSTDHPEMKKILLRAFQFVRNSEVQSFYSKSTLAQGFARTLLWLLRDFPILIVDPSDPELKELSAPFFKRFFARKGSLRSLLAKQNDLLRSRNYPVQVGMEEDSLPLFQIDNQERTRLPLDTAFESVSLRKLSPSALLRPLFQDFLFPTLAYVAGPAEIAYFAQLHPWYEAMEMKQPWLCPRASLTLLPQAVRNFLESKNLSPEECFLKEDTLADALIHNEAMTGARQDLKELSKGVAETFRKIKDTGRTMDSTLIKSIETSERKIMYQIHKTERKFFLAAKRADSLLLQQLRKAKNVLFPEEKLQERSLNAFSFNSRLPDLVTEVYHKIDWNLPGHLWVPI